MSFFTKRYHPPGTGPGTLGISGVPPKVPPKISVINYSGDLFKERAEVPVAACRDYIDQPGVTWIHVQGDPDAGTLTKLGELFGLHDLALEDIVNSGQRPKVELYGEQLFVILSHPIIDEDYAGTEQVSLFLGSNFIFSFHDGTHDPFEPIRNRLRKRSGSLREKGADYLLYALIDLVIDQCFPVLERYGAELEDIEELLLEAPTKEILRRLHELKRNALLLRRMIWPQREVLNSLMRNEEFPLGDAIKPYFRDCYDHTVQIMDLLETYRDMTSGLVELYLSSVSNRMNEIMRVLTVIATIFIPLTFIAGVYGMNFGNNSTSPWAMPELKWYYGYPITWGLMLVIAFGLLYVFKRNDWF